ncbi:hypothetical protein KC354_g1119 [Hortaea werneckii]|nr:hypothetical protein KC354_g1119 [Hortaea werneckii]
MASLLQSMRLSNSFFDSTEPLMLPAIPTSSVADSELDVSTLTQQHQKFYLTDRRLYRDQAREKAMGDVKAIRYAFPESRQSQTQLLMCSWFALLCAVDDEIESLRSDEAHDTLTQLTLDIQQHRHAQVLKQFDSGRIQSRLHGRQEEHSRLETLNQRLALSAKTSLHPTQYHDFLKQIVQVWESMKDEIALRQSGVNNEKTYIQIRSRTVGLAPFFTLLKAEICQESDSDAVIDVHLDRLQELVSIVVGLQNDLVGLERDLASLETCNLISFKARTSPGSSIAQAAGEVIRMHNQQILHAVEAFGEVLERCEKKSGYTLVAHSMLGFATRHFVWASKAERHRV